jgi:hypothetical protein
MADRSDDQDVVEAQTANGASTATHPDAINWGRASKQEEAARWLWIYLESKPNMAATSWTIKSDAARSGITRGTLYAAKRRMTVSVYEHGDFDADQGIGPTTAWSLLHLRAIRIGSTLYRPKPTRRTGRRQPNVIEQPRPLNANEAYGDKIRKQIEILAHHLASRPWTGAAREARVMSSVLRRCGKQNSLRTEFTVWSLADESGFAGWEPGRDALDVLQAEGWVTVQHGVRDTYEKGQFQPTQRGKPTVVTLIPKEKGPRYPVAKLPNGARDEFAGDPGNSRYLFIMRVLFEGRTEGLTRPEIEKMTGLSRTTVQRLVKTDTLLCKTTAGTWNVIAPELLTKDGNDSKMQARRAKRKATSPAMTRKRPPDPTDQDRANLEALRRRLTG